VPGSVICSCSSLLTVLRALNSAWAPFQLLLVCYPAVATELVITVLTGMELVRVTPVMEVWIAPSLAQVHPTTPAQEMGTVIWMANVNAVETEEV